MRVSDIAGMVRRPVVAAGIAAAVVVGGLVSWWLLGLSPNAAPSPAAPGAGTAPLTSERATELTNDLRSGQENEVRDAVALPADQPLDSTATSALARIDLSFDVATFHDTGQGTATVVGHTSNGKWTVTLVVADDRWKISRAEPAS